MGFAWRRSLCTTLGAAEAFKPAHLETAEVKALVDGAKFFYLGGFFLTHGVESAKILAQHAADNNKVCGAAAFRAHGRTELTNWFLLRRSLP